MTDVTYQDIQNKVTALRGCVNLGRKPEGAKDQISHIEKILEIAETIHSLVQKTKDCQQLGMDQGRWIPVEKMVRMQFSFLRQKEGVSLDCDVPGLEIDADPLVERVFYNLLQPF